VLTTWKLFRRAFRRYTYAPLDLFGPLLPPLFIHPSALGIQNSHRFSLSTCLKEKTDSTQASCDPFTMPPTTSSRSSSISSASSSGSKSSDAGLKKKFGCSHPGCGKSFSRSEHLHRHALNHKDGNNTCLRCSAHFRRRDLLGKLPVTSIGSQLVANSMVRPTYGSTQGEG
jgi:uncharacterized Zn-finger protein